MIKRFTKEDFKTKTDMELYASQYPGCKFVGFWRKCKNFNNYVHSVDPFWRSKQIEEQNNAIKDNLLWPEDLIDEKQSPEILNQVAEYLDNCKFGEHYMGHSFCRICHKDLGCSDRTDGEWVWPDELSHYLLEHKVRLPDEFIKYVLKKSS